MSLPESITCPVCELTSNDKLDIYYGYCERCKTFTTETDRSDAGFEEITKPRTRRSKWIFGIACVFFLLMLFGPRSGYWFFVSAVWICNVAQLYFAFKTRRFGRLSKGRLVMSKSKVEMMVRGLLEESGKDWYHIGDMPYSEVLRPPRGHMCINWSTHIDRETGKLTYYCPCGKVAVANSGKEKFRRPRASKVNSR